MRGLVLSIASAVILVSTLADAAPNRQACVAAYEDTQVSMRRSRLLHAREALRTCLHEACPAVLQSDCAGWLKEVEARTPSVVVECISGGKPVRDARLFVDGELRPNGIDGRAMELDPGTHSFRVETASSAPVTVEAIVPEGEKLRVVRIELPESDAPTAPHAADQTRPVGTHVAPRPSLERRPVPWTVYAAAGLGVAAGAGFAWFATSGASMKSDLEPCKPECSAERISDVRTQFIVADVLLGVTAVALGTAAYLFLTRPATSTTSALFVGPGGGRFAF